MQRLRVGNRNKRIISAHSNLARYLNFGEPPRQTRKSSRIITDKFHRLKKSGPGVGSEVVLQDVVGNLVMLNVCDRAANKLLSGQIFERFKRRRVDDFL